METINRPQPTWAEDELDTPMMDGVYAPTPARVVRHPMPRRRCRSDLRERRQYIQSVLLTLGMILCSETILVGLFLTMP